MPKDASCGEGALHIYQQHNIQHKALCLCEVTNPYWAANNLTHLCVKASDMTTMISHQLLHRCSYVRAQGDSILYRLCLSIVPCKSIFIKQINFLSLFWILTINKKQTNKTHTHTHTHTHTSRSKHMHNTHILHPPPPLKKK